MSRRVASALVLTAVLAGCGGDGDGDTLQLTFTPSTIAVATWADRSGRSAYVTAMVRPLPSEQTYVHVFDSGAAFVPGEVIAYALGDDTFGASLPIRDGLAADTYTGTLTVRICRDALCADPYTLSQSTIPYTIVVHAVSATPTVPTAVVKVDGAIVASEDQGISGYVHTYRVAIAAGQTVELEPSLPFLTRGFGSPFYTPLTFMLFPPSPSGGLRATVTFAPGTTESTGSITLEGRAEGGGAVHLVVNATR